MSSHHALLTLLLCIAPACSESQAVTTGEHPDVLLITVDTLRHDFVSCYGFPIEVTPSIDSLARNGTLFETHRTVISLTLPSHATLFSGLYPSEHGTRRNSTPVDAAPPLLAELFQRAGYRTAACVGSTVLGRTQGLLRGFESYDDEMPSDARTVGAQKEFFERPAKLVVEHAMKALEQDDERPLFLWVHLFDAHEPYVAPAEYLELAKGSNAVHAARTEPSTLVDAERQVRQRTGYEAEVRYVDHCIGELLRAWDADRRRRGGLVVLTSDHGQGLGEHDYTGHGFRLYEEQLRVPLILRELGRVPAGSRIEGPTSSIDVATTIAELAALPGRETLGGASMVPLLATQSAPPGRPILAERREWTAEDVQRVGEVAKLLEHLRGKPGATRGDQTAWIEGRWKCIWSADVPGELYDLESDPAEAHDLAPTAASEWQALRGKIEGWRGSVKLRALGPEAASDPQVEKGLQQLGY